MNQRGRHQSTCKSGKATLRKVSGVKGVRAVIIGMSTGGKSLGNAATGSLKIQRRLNGGLKALLQSSKGVQEIYIQVEPGIEALVQARIEELEGVVVRR